MNSVCLYSGVFEQLKTLEYMPPSFSTPHPHASSISHLPFGKFFPPIHIPHCCESYSAESLSL